MHAANYGQAIARRKRLVEESEQKILDGNWSFAQDAIQFAIAKMATSLIECEDALDMWATSKEINLKNTDYVKFKEAVNLYLSPFWGRYRIIAALCHLVIKE